MVVIKGFIARTIGIVKLIVAIVYIVGRVMGFVEWIIAITKAYIVIIRRDASFTLVSV